MVLGETSCGATQFRATSSIFSTSSCHALHDNDVDVIDGDVAKAVHAGLQVEPKPALPLDCRCRVPLTQVHNPSGVLLLYQDQLDA